LKQWVNGRFNKWRIFDSPPGFAKTNNPLESFNAAIKREYSYRERLSLIDCLEALQKLVKTYSTQSRTVDAFIVDSVPTASMISSASTVKESDFVEERGLHVLNYEGDKYNLCLRKRRCDCCEFVKYKMCVHLVAASRFFPVPNLDFREFVYKEKKGKKVSKALSYN
jgi:hypothetical protein